MKRTKIEDISKNPEEQLLSIEAEDLMPLPSNYDETDNKPPVKPLSQEQKEKYECSLDGVSAIRIPKPQVKRRRQTGDSFLEWTGKITF